MIKLGKIVQLEDKNERDVYPITSSKAIIMDDNTTILQDEINNIKNGNVRYDKQGNYLEYFDKTDKKWKILDFDINGDGGGSGLNSILLEDITVTGVTVGNLKPGDLLKRGTSITEVLKQMLIYIIPPTYTKPSINFTSSTTIVEAGSLISPTLKLSYNKNDGGEAIGCSITGEDLFVENKYTVALESFRLNEPMSFTATVNYSEGPTKTNNAGELDDRGKILAGSLSKNLTISPKRAYFAFCDSSSDVPTDSYIRNRDYKGLDLKENSNVVITTSEDTKLVCFAYPKDIRDCTRIRYEELNDNDNKTSFTQSTLYINDASGQNPIAYRVYYYIPPIPFGTKATFVMTI